MKKSGQPFGKLDKMKPELRADIERYMSDRSVQLGPLLQKTQYLSKHLQEVYADNLGGKEGE